MRRACEDWGAFYLTGHGVATQAVESQTRRLFDLPAETKLRALRSPGGTTGYGVSRISTFFSKRMWHEGFIMMGSPVQHAKEIWPLDHYNFCEVMIEYQNQMKQLAEKIFKLLLNSLNISDDQPRDNTPGTSLQLNSYPRCPDPTRAMGLAPHTDTFFLTFVHQTASPDSGGLQILKDGAWVSVPAVPGAMVVNVGDLLHVMSGGLLKSVVHRVAVNRTAHRYSLAFFYGPPWDYTVSPSTVDPAVAEENEVEVVEVLPSYHSVR